MCLEGDSLYDRGKALHLWSCLFFTTPCLSKVGQNEGPQFLSYLLIYAPLHVITPFIAWALPTRYVKRRLNQFHIFLLAART